ncbi:hypothetical protein FCN77_05675 [Arthrobacter sp. 24S4-2]|uniref:hypothetical protein n=1 Tax=Arthrobacter sp. 24S4-2 TaxID=2575374 RepID=UPI0010C7BAB3|nr:hypothetical protein [Arthrobacter sp. 24S4-2]QCO97299.1 hypothetical protein FCN77_05675 [Arthrobacter sp. 24S4-2]
MELLNISPVPILPRTMWVAYRALQATPGLTRRELEDAVCPPTMREETPGKGAHTERAVDALVKFGLVDIDEGTEGDGRTLSAPGHASLQSFTRNLRDCVLGAAVTEEPMPQDLNRAVVWLLSQSPLDAYDRLRADKELGGFFVNDTRWNTFRYWATFLGLGREWPLEGGGLAVDPTPAVEDAIVNPKGSEVVTGTSIEARQLVRHVQAEIPAFVQVDTNQADSAPTSMAYAFRALQASGRLKFENRSDSRSLVRLPAGAGAADDALFTHVTIEVGNL